MTTVFVYGTLKTGLELSDLLAGQSFIGVAHTTPHFRLAALEGGDYPGLYAVHEGGRSIQGELWSVSPDCLAELDRVEGVDEDLYARQPISLLPPDDSHGAHAYFYLGDISRCPDAGTCW